MTDNRKAESEISEQPASRPTEWLETAGSQASHHFPGTLMTNEPAITIRHVVGVGWQVLLDGDKWHTCRKEQDARYIAHGVLISEAVKAGERTGEETARELDEVIAMVGHQVGECEALRLMKAAATHARDGSGL